MPIEDYICKCISQLIYIEHSQPNNQYSAQNVQNIT